MLDLINIAHAVTEAAAESSAHEPTGAIGTLGLNLKLFIAQLVNFGIVLLVLWKWVFTPIAKKLTERTEKIEKAMKDAANTEKEKQNFEKWKDMEIAKVRSQASAVISDAEREARKVKADIAAETKIEQEKIVKQARERIEQEKQTAVREVKSQMADLVTLASEKIIKEKLNSDKDKQLISNTLKELT